MMARPSARHAYVQAEVATALAHQVRALRLQRGWSQKDLARRLGTTQAGVSRLEDPGYGRLNLGTLLQLSQVFDTGLQVRFVSMVRMLRDTFRPQAVGLQVPPFEEEAQQVAFVATQPTTIGGYHEAILLNVHHACAAGELIAAAPVSLQQWVTLPAPPLATQPQLIEAHE